RKGDLELDSPYNTYRRAGLPPGPIAAPGAAALHAVLHPVSSEDLYFVSRNDGSHQFSRTLAEHEHWVTVYQRHRRAALEGGGAASATTGTGTGTEAPPIASPAPSP